MSAHSLLVVEVVEVLTIDFNNESRFDLKN